MSDSQVLILGGGISGCLTACQLADKGIEVAVIEQNGTLMSGASRWNEGRIHLGYTYTGTSSLASALLMQEGAAVFESVIERVIGGSLPESWYSEPAIYLVDKETLFTPDVLWDRARMVAAALGRAAQRRCGLRHHTGSGPVLERLEVDRARAETGQNRVMAAWRTTERAISPGPLAECIRAAVAARDIPVMKGRVCSAEMAAGDWRINLDGDQSVLAPVIVNSLWESRALLDQPLQPTSESISIRYKLAIFGSRLPKLVGLSPSTRILGPFGGVTTFGNGDAYLSWYPACRVARSDNGLPPDIPDVDRDCLVDETLHNLDLDSSVLKSAGGKWEIRGGFIVAHGRGDIDRTDSPLHHRHHPDARELRAGYISVDTGKLTLGPLLSMKAVALTQRRLASHV